MSQCAAILRVLRDGQVHSVREIHERAGFSRLNSRITDLRKQGHSIDHFCVEAVSQVDRHVYRLVSSPDACSGVSGVAAETATVAPVDPLPGAAAQQLNLWTAA